MVTSDPLDPTPRAISGFALSFLLDTAKALNIEARWGQCRLAIYLFLPIPRLNPGPPN